VYAPQVSALGEPVLGFGCIDDRPNVLPRKVLQVGDVHPHLLDSGSDTSPHFWAVCNCASSLSVSSSNCRYSSLAVTSTFQTTLDHPSITSV